MCNELFNSIIYSVYYNSFNTRSRHLIENSSYSLYQEGHNDKENRRNKSAPEEALTDSEKMSQLPASRLFDIVYTAPPAYWAKSGKTHRGRARKEGDVPARKNLRSAIDAIVQGEPFCLQSFCPPKGLLFPHFALIHFNFFLLRILSLHFTIYQLTPLNCLAFVRPMQISECAIIT